MIGKLTGTIDSVATRHLILDVNGVGYIVHASTRTLSMIGGVGSVISLLIDTYVREDAFTLYGFADASEQEWFRLLNSVQGVGAKAAFSILAVCAVNKLALIIASEDKASITQADGVGPKLAARILTELKDKAAKMDLSLAHDASGAGIPVAAANIAPMDDGGADLDAVSALMNLGYARSDAYQAVMSVKSRANDNDKDLQSIIRAALKELSA